MQNFTCEFYSWGCSRAITLTVSAQTYKEAVEKAKKQSRNKKITRVWVDSAAPLTPIKYEALRALTGELDN